MNLLFVCSRNLFRSPTAEAVFHSVAGVSTRSAGSAADAEHVIDADDLAWCDVILVMEPFHRRRLNTLFKSHLKGKRIVCLDIPDDYEFMQPELLELLWERVPLAVPELTVHRPLAK